MAIQLCREDMDYFSVNPKLSDIILNITVPVYMSLEERQKMKEHILVERFPENL